jgi:hypothetical protein
MIIHYKINDSEASCFFNASIEFQFALFANRVFLGAFPKNTHITFHLENEVRVEIRDSQFSTGKIPSQKLILCDPQAL